MIETVEIETRPVVASVAPRVRIITDLGDLLVELHPDRAPKSVAAFLAEVRAGAYDGGSFGRIVRADNDRGAPVIAVVQGLSVGTGEVRADVEHESTADSGLRHEDGTISLPRIDGGLGSAQGFFICIGAQPALDSGGGRTADGLGFAAFGRVVAGMAVARAIHALPTKADAPIDYLMGQIPVAPAAIRRIAPEAATPAALLHDLADDYWRFRVREFPVDASAAGDRRGNRLLDELSDAAFARRARLCAAMLARAEAIDGGTLDAESATTLALLTQQLATIVEAHDHDEHHRPQLFPWGFFSTPSMLAQQTALDTVVDRDEFLARLEGMPAYLAAGLDLLREGFRRGYRVPRILQSRILALLDADLAGEGLAATVTARFAPAIAGADAALLEAQRGRAAALVADAIAPGLRAVRDVVAGLEAELVDAVGLSSQPGGRDYYRFKVRQQTSTDTDPDSIHAIGLAEVARIQAELDAVLVGMGRPGERAAVAAELEARVAPDAETLLSHARAYAKRVDGLLPRLFGRMPRITYGVEPLTAAASAALPPALAQPAPADRSMPGIYWLTALPEKLPLHLIPALTLHEAWPGHLMQFSIAHELDRLPDFRRYTWQDYNGYVEGWALYSERLGDDLGLYDDPADRFGLLSFELWRAARLVVDTGIHWLGWSRAQAIDYLDASSFLPRMTCESEVDRYIGMPAQALSYKMGERVIHGLRADAEAALGEAFSLRALHDMILGLGPVSLSELDRRVHAWIAVQGSGE